MAIVTTRNLATNEEHVYVDVKPEDAVKYSHLQSIGNNNTWTWDRTQVRIWFGNYTVACGDWCARK